MSRATRQLWALVVLEVRTGTRRHKLSKTSRVSALVLTIVVYALMGMPTGVLLYAQKSGGAAGLASTPDAKLIGWTMGIAALLALTEMEQLWVARRQHEIMAALPVARARTLLAKAIVLVALAVTAALAFSASAWIIGTLVSRVGWHFAWLMPLSVTLAAMTAASAALCASLLLLKLVPARFARGAFALVRVVVAMVALVAPYLVMMREQALDLPAWADQVPLLWLAAPLAVAEHGLVGALRWQLPAGLGLWLLSMVALLPALKAVDDRVVDASRSEGSVTHARPTSARAAWLAPRDRLAAAAYHLTPRVLWRDARLRSAMLAQVMFPLLYLGFLGIGPFPRLLLVVLFAPLFLSFAMGMLQTCASSDHPDAAWILSTLPADDLRPMWSGVGRYLYLHLLLPAALVASGVAAALAREPLVLLASFPMLAAFAAAGLELGHFLVREPPFARPFQAGGGSSRLVTSLVVVLLLFGIAIAMVMSYVVWSTPQAVALTAVLTGLVLWTGTRLARVRWAPRVEPPGETAT